MTSLTGSITYTNGSTYSGLSALPANTYDSNSNIITVSTTGTVAASSNYFGIVTPVGSYVLYSNLYVYQTTAAATNLGAGASLTTYFTMYVQPASSPLSCAPTTTFATAPVVQMSYCLITSSTTGPSLTGSLVYANASGILSAVALSSTTYQMTALNGSITYTNGSTYSGLSALPLNTFDSNTNTFIVAATTGVLSATYYLGFSSPLGSYVVYSNSYVLATSTAAASFIGPGSDITAYSTMTVQPYTAGGSQLLCSPTTTIATAPAVQFSYCLITSAVSSPTLTGTAVYSNASGIMSALALSSTSYLMTGINGSITFTNGSTYTGGFSVLPAGTFDTNSNTFTVSAGTASATYYLGITTPLGSYVLYGSSSVYTVNAAAANLGAGTGTTTYFTLYVQTYTPGGPVQPCSPTTTFAATPTVQMSYCLITATSAGPTLAGTTVYSNASGLVTARQLSSTTFQMTALSGSLTYTNGTTLSGLSLLAPGTYDQNSNVFVVSATGTLATSVYYFGLSSPIGSYVFYSNQNVYTTTTAALNLGTGSAFSTYFTMYVQPYNSTSGVLSCSPTNSIATAPVVPLSFCLVTSVVQYPNITGTVAYANASGTMNALRLSNTSYLMTSVNGSITYPSGVTYSGLSVLPVGTYDSNSNMFSVAATGASVANSYIGLVTPLGSYVFYSNAYAYSTTTAATNLGPGYPFTAYYSMFVQPLNSASGALSCNPTTINTAPTVQFSYCLITSPTAAPTLSASTVLANASGIFTAVQLSSLQYQIKSLNGTLFTASGTSAVSLLPVNTYDSNTNLFTVSAAGTVSGYYYIGVGTSIGSYVLYNGANVYSSSTAAVIIGAYGTMYVQPYTRAALCCPAIPLIWCKSPIPTAAAPATILPRWVALI